MLQGPMKYNFHLYFKISHLFSILSFYRSLRNMLRRKSCVLVSQRQLYLFIAWKLCLKSESCRHAGFPTNVISCGNVRVNSVSQKTDHSALCLSDFPFILARTRQLRWPLFVPGFLQNSSSSLLHKLSSHGCNYATTFCRSLRELQHKGYASCDFNATSGI